jgi:hypothetical protein
LRKGGENIGGFHAGPTPCASPARNVSSARGPHFESALTRRRAGKAQTPSALSDARAAQSLVIHAVPESCYRWESN